MRLKFFIFLFYTTSLTALNFSYTNFAETTYKTKQPHLSIKAQKKVENFKKDVKTLFFNRKKYVSENFYYEKGSVSNTEYHINFKRMFVYGKNFYITKASGSFFNYKFRAKSLIIYKDKIVFKHIFFQSKNKKGSKLKFTYFFDKQNKI